MAMKENFISMAPDEESNASQFDRSEQNVDD